jgi:hypothetical protein
MDLLYPVKTVQQKRRHKLYFSRVIQLMPHTPLSLDVMHHSIPPSITIRIRQLFAGLYICHSDHERKHHRIYFNLNHPNIALILALYILLPIKRIRDHLVIVYQTHFVAVHHRTHNKLVVIFTGGTCLALPYHAAIPVKFQAF